VGGRNECRDRYIQKLLQAIPFDRRWKGGKGGKGRNFVRRG